MEDVYKAIIHNLIQIVRNEKGERLDQVGSYIVGATLARDDADELFVHYPLLEEIGELGADLETLRDSPHAKEIFNEIIRKLQSL